MQYSVRPAALKVKTLERTESETVNVQVPVESITSEASAKAEDADTEKPAEEEAKAADAMEADTGAAGEAAAPETTNGAMAAEVPKTVVEVDERNFNDKLGWREALGYQHPLKGWQNLWIRFATD